MAKNSFFARHRDASLMCLVTGDAASVAANLLEREYAGNAQKVFGSLM
jgi:hypothetical protein